MEQTCEEVAKEQTDEGAGEDIEGVMNAEVHAAIAVEQDVEQDEDLECPLGETHGCDLAEISCLEWLCLPFEEIENHEERGGDSDGVGGMRRGESVLSAGVAVDEVE